MSPAAFEALDCLCLPLLLRHETRHHRCRRPEKTWVWGTPTGVLQDPGTHRPPHSQEPLRSVVDIEDFNPAFAIGRANLSLSAIKRQIKLLMNVSPWILNLVTATKRSASELANTSWRTRQRRAEDGKWTLVGHFSF